MTAITVVGQDFRRVAVRPPRRAQRPLHAGPGGRATRRPAAPAWRPVDRAARSCAGVTRPATAARPAASGGAVRYEWTERGIAVMLGLIALVVAAVVTTIVMAFLSVSNEPLPATGQPAGVVGAAAAVGVPG